MKPLNIRLIALILATLTPCISHADGKAQCEKKVNQGVFYHCSYIKGTTDDRRDGRYIKIYDDENQWTTTSCHSASTITDMVGGGPNMLAGTHFKEYFICTDPTGYDCERIATDTYRVVDNGNKMDPAYFEVDITAFKDRYATCYDETMDW